jgi:hypothetical protein
VLLLHLTHRLPPLRVDIALLLLVLMVGILTFAFVRVRRNAHRHDSIRVRVVRASPINPAEPLD